MNGGRTARSPSRTRRRSVIVVLALLGFLVSLYLACFQVGVVTSVFDPFFGSASSEAVLKSSFSRALPVPDAAVGALAYLIEIVLDSIGGERRFATRPWLVLLFGSVALGAAATGVFLVGLQAFFVQSWCALCLSSALISWLIFLLCLGEVRAALGEVRARHRAGASWRGALFSRPTRVQLS